MSLTKCGNLYILGKETHVQVIDASKYLEVAEIQATFLVDTGEKRKTTTLKRVLNKSTVDPH